MIEDLKIKRSILIPLFVQMGVYDKQLSNANVLSNEISQNRKRRQLAATPAG